MTTDAATGAEAGATGHVDEIVLWDSSAAEAFQRLDEQTQITTAAANDPHQDGLQNLIAGVAATRLHAAGKPITSYDIANQAACIRSAGTSANHPEVSEQPNGLAETLDRAAYEPYVESAAGQDPQQDGCELEVARQAVDRLCANNVLPAADLVFALAQQIRRERAEAVPEIVAALDDEIAALDEEIIVATDRHHVASLRLERSSTYLSKLEQRTQGDHDVLPEVSSYLQGRVLTVGQQTRELEERADASRAVLMGLQGERYSRLRQREGWQKERVEWIAHTLSTLLIRAFRGQ